MLFYNNVFSSKKIKNENRPNPSNFDSSMVWASPQTKKNLPTDAYAGAYPGEACRNKAHPKMY